MIMPKALGSEVVSISLKRYERVSLTTTFIDSHNMSFPLFVCLLRQCSGLRVACCLPVRDRTQTGALLIGNKFYYNPYLVTRNPQQLYMSQIEAADSYGLQVTLCVIKPTSFPAMNPSFPMFLL